MSVSSIKIERPEWGNCRLLREQTHMMIVVSSGDPEGIGCLA
jgi:hypothetical protein